MKPSRQSRRQDLLPHVLKNINVDQKIGPDIGLLRKLWDSGIVSNKVYIMAESKLIKKSRLSATIINDRTWLQQCYFWSEKSQILCRRFTIGAGCVYLSILLDYRKRRGVRQGLAESAWRSRPNLKGRITHLP
jgi:hypothetical protein